MTCSQKITVCGVVAMAASFLAFYQSRQAARLRDQLQAGEKQEAVLAEQIQQLQRDRDEAARRRASPFNDRDPSEPQMAELLRLRGQLGVLRQETNELEKLQEENRLWRQYSPSGVPEPPMVTQGRSSFREAYARYMIQAFLAYARDNQGQLPSSFEQAWPFWPKTEAGNEVPDRAKLAEQGGVATDTFEIMYEGSLDALTNLDVIVFRERKLWADLNGRRGRLDVLANGQVQYVPDGSMPYALTDYEKKHLAPGSEALLEKRNRAAGVNGQGLLDDAK